MKRHLPILLVCSTVVALSFGCNGADEVTAPQLMPKKVAAEPPNSRMQPVVVERPRAPGVALAHPRGSVAPADPTPTPRAPGCWKNTDRCADP
jgi:hypothetical protein